MAPPINRGRDIIEPDDKASHGNQAVRRSHASQLTAMVIVRVQAYFRTTAILTPLDTDAGATQSGV